MKKSLLCLSIFCSVAIFSQSENPATKNFNPNTLITIQGHITQIRTVSSSGRVGVVLQLQTNQGKMNVLLGPKKFVQKQEINLKIHDVVQVTGSKTFVEGRRVIVTTTLQKHGKSYTFRDKNGSPEWNE
jgi:hypothetical protein